MPNYYLQKLTKAVPHEDYKLEVTFEDRFTATIDLRPWIERAPLRAPLFDPAVFAAVMVNEFGVPEWPGEIDLSPGTLRAWCESGRVLSKRGTDEWINVHSEKTQGVA